VAITSIIVLLAMQGIEFFGILVLLCIACIMTGYIMQQGDNDLNAPSEDVIELRETVKALDEKIDELKKLLEE
jgi:hypothetical protein